MSDQPPTETRLRTQLIALTITRLFINTGIRMVYPFLPALSRGVVVSLPVMGQAIALRSFVGMLSPFFAPISERFGRRAAMIGSLLFFAAAALLVVVWPAFWPLVAGLSLISIAKVIFDPALQAYIGDRVPYQRRGRAVAVVELAWAGSLLLGAPAVGWLIARFGWTAPFAALAIAAVVACLVLRRLLPAGMPQRSRAGNWRGMLQIARQHPVVLAAAVFVGGAMMANELIAIVFGEWMEESFGLSLTNLGLAAAVIGGAEVGGEVVTGLLTDRLGKRPMIVVTGLRACILYLLLPLASTHLAFALVMLFLTFFCFEIMAVSSISLMTQIVPDARGPVMSVSTAAGSLGRAGGAWLGPLLWTGFGLGANAGAGATIGVLSLVVLALWVREGEETS